MKKRFLGLLLALILAVALFPTAAGAIDISDPSVFVPQQGRSTCTLASVTMLLRRKAVLDGDANWASITESAVKKVAWTGGLAWNFTYNGVHISVMRSSSGWAGSSLDSKRKALIDLLAAHPEGIVAYCTSQPHAVLLTDYDANSGTFYCCDPAPYYFAGRTPLVNSSIRGGSQDAILGRIKQLWYADSGLSKGAGTASWANTSTDTEEALAADDASASTISTATSVSTATAISTVAPVPVARDASQTIRVDGQEVELQMYALTDEGGNDVNYVKLRDLAQALNGSEAQFNVAYDGEVALTTRTPYLAEADSASPFQGDQPYTTPETETLVDGVATQLTAIQLTDQQGGGYLYYNLRDLGQVLGYGVDWDPQTGICLNTTQD